LIEIDGSLKCAVVHCLEVLGASFLSAHFMDANVTLWCASPRFESGVKDLQRSIREIGEIVLGEQAGYRAGVKEWGGYYLAIWMSTTGLLGRESFASEHDYCVVAFRREVVEDGANDHFLNEHARSATYVIFEALRQRTYLFLPFPPKVSERYWDDALRAPGKSSVLRPPWAASKSLDTVSLSFDLRKSTFCMENADTPEKFSTWIDQLVRILTKITHSKGGVFDKFTGDGALVHFLDDECKMVYGTVAVVAALECAIGMQRATTRHLEKLREFLRLDSERLGGAIGIDVALAHWSLDHRNNPIVVGRGVVGACRLGDGTAPGRVRLTNIAYRKLGAVGGGVYHAQSVSFTSKEFSRDMKLAAWEVDASMIGSGPSWAWVDQICDEVYDIKALQPK